MSEEEIECGCGGTLIFVGEDLLDSWYKCNTCHLVKTRSRPLYFPEKTLLMKAPKMVWTRDQFGLIDNGFHDGKQELHPLVCCMSCGTEMIDFGDDHEDDMGETLADHKERCQRFKE